MHVDAVAPCRLNPIQQQLGFGPIISVGELHVDQLDMDAAGLPDIDGFRNGFMDAVRFVAGVGGVSCAVLLQYRAERMQFIRFAVTASSDKQSRRKPKRTSVQLFFEHLLHMEQLAVVRRAVLHSHRHQAQRFVADLHNRVHRNIRPGIHVVREIRLLEGQPRRAAGEISLQLFDLLRKRRRHREAAITDNLGRHTLPNLPFRLRVKQQGEVGMRVNVD